MVGLQHFKTKCHPQTLRQVVGKRKTAKQNSHQFVMK